MLHLELERVQFDHNDEYRLESKKQKKVRASYGAEEDESRKSDSDSSDDEEVVDPTPT